MSDDSKLTRAIGNAIKDFSEREIITHLQILRALEALRHEFTEDFITTHPEIVWKLHRH